MYHVSPVAVSMRMGSTIESAGPATTWNLPAGHAYVGRMYCGVGKVKVFSRSAPCSQEKPARQRNPRRTMKRGFEFIELQTRGQQYLFNPVAGMQQATGWSRRVMASWVEGMRILNPGAHHPKHQTPPRRRYGRTLRVVCGVRDPLRFSCSGRLRVLW
jgi:hypothetical protein